MTRTLVIGGGIAGAVSAMALAKAGFEPVLFEAYPASAEHRGTYLTVAVNGLSALHAVGALDSIRTVGCPSPRIAFYLGNGHLLNEVPVGGALPDGTTTRSVRRGDLQAILLEEVRRRGIPVFLGKRLETVEESPDGVTAHFSDGTSASGELLVGCDGVHSTVRRLIRPEYSQARYTGLVNIGGFTPSSRAELPPGEHRMMFGGRAFFGFVVATAGEVWWFANVGRRRAVTKHELQRITDAEWRGRLAGIFARDKGPTRALVEGSGPVTVTNSYQVDDLPVWHSARMVLVGDAAHAASPAAGQGASMAMEDAVELAKCLRDLPSRAEAFRAYEALRRPRARRVTVQGEHASRFKSVSPLRRRLRDRKLPAILAEHAAGTERSLAWIYRYRVDWETPVSVQPSDEALR